MKKNSSKWFSKAKFVLPVVVYLLLMQAYPLINALFTSLTDKTIGVEGQFIGLTNYFQLFQEELFWQTVKNSFLFTFGAIILKLVFGMIMALVLNQPLRLINLWRALLFLPWTISTIVTILVFGFIFSSTGGVLNTILMEIGVIKQPIGWFSTPLFAMGAIITVNVWRGTPFFGLSILSGLQAVSKDQYEAAEIDGANLSQRFLYITIPSIKNVILLVSVVSTIWTLNDFQVIWVLTRGGPVNSTQVFSTLTYTTAFLNLQLAKGIAVSVTSVPLMFLLIYWVTKSIKNQRD
ncbi:MAG: sugar ABC transporter permease [Anaerolineaceae bacterium]|nr:sugar ABC transporter permease [Anaerolineaceae bacterium]